MFLGGQLLSRAQRLTRLGARVLGAAPLLSAGIALLPVPPVPPPSLDTSVLTTTVQQATSILPATIPSLPATASPAATLPSGVSAPVVDSAAQRQTGGATAGAPTSSGPGGSAPSGGGGPTRGAPIPFTAILVASPLDVALLGAIATLPLLLAIWLFLATRTLFAARRARDSQVRLTLAADLGLRPRELTSMSTKALFKLREESAFDDLTGSLRRAAGISMAEREIARAHRQRTPLTVAFVDVDGLKEANDRKGHAAGDRLLRGVSRSLRDGLRGQDLLLRYGGDEFICVLPDTTSDAARAKLRTVQSDAQRAGVRFTFGVAELTRSDDIVSLLARADRELYEFKARRGEIVELPPSGTAGKRKQGRASA